MKTNRFFILIPAAIVAVSCSGGTDSSSGGATPGVAKTSTNLTIAAYSVARPLYEKGLIPAFKASYSKAHSGSSVDFTETYEGSGAQTRAILAGLKADIAALQLSTEIDQLSAADLVSKDWSRADNAGVPATSVVVLEVRSGNPKKIKDWSDLARADVQVVMPNPDTSGGAKYNVAAIDTWASAQGANEAASLKNVRSHVVAFGKSSKEAQQIFSTGQGDVLVGLECEAASRKEAGDAIEIVYPPKTVETDPPVVAVVQKGAQPNPAADEFVKFLSTADAQRIFAKNHFRPRDVEIAKEFASSFPSVQVVTIDQLDGWSVVGKKLFEKDGLWTKAAAPSK